VSTAQPIQTPVGTADGDDRAITSQHLWEVALKHISTFHTPSATAILAAQMIKSLLVDDPNSGQSAPLLDAIYDEINRSR
jgi:hypothetical protein